MYKEKSRVAVEPIIIIIIIIVIVMLGRSEEENQYKEMKAGFIT